MAAVLSTPAGADTVPLLSRFILYKFYSRATMAFLSRFCPTGGILAAYGKNNFANYFSFLPPCVIIGTWKTSCKKLTADT